MVDLQILSGRRAGSNFRCERFPIRVGRAEGLDLSLDESGVWPRHFQIIWQPHGLMLEADPDALVSVNDTVVKQSPLRNGDVITLGSLKIRFSLSAVRQSSITFREWLTWISLGALCLVQVTLVYLLLRL
ncbi:MAG TPA: FHA domain-containing protein [Verrucomicrobiae bacterium]|jgi:predicted component of type VI protein secretion system